MRLVFCAGIAVCAFAASSESLIRLNQAGYLPRAPKTAVVAAESDSFTVRDARSGAVVFSGKTGEPVQDADSGDRVRIADFSALTKPGRYAIEAAGAGRSYEFTIGPGVYDRLYYLAMRSFYGQRCGTAVDLGSGFPGYRYEACHATGAWHASSGRSGPRASARGWHDAGDYGRYVVNSGITTGALLWTYEMFGRRIGKTKLNIPESGNGTPDILNEIRWNLDWMLSMQDEDGGVWHKQTTERFSGFVMPEKDTMPSVVIGTGAEPYRNSCATADFAAVMAIAARVYGPFQADFAGRSLTAAKHAFAWVEKNPNVLFSNPKGVATGAYGDRNCSDERLWAAAELWRTTKDAAYAKHFLSGYRELLAGGLRPPSWPSVGPLALWTYALGAGPDKMAVQEIRDASLRAADEIAERTTRHPYRMSMTTRDYVWGSNSVAANYGLQLLVANALKPDVRYVNAAADNLHYLLGRNPFSVSWVTGMGSNPFRHPHHRPSGADSNPEPWPGLLSGGPNGRKQDPAMNKMADLPPARMWLDEQESYASNENAINWNAALVFLTAGVMSEGR